LYKILRKQDLAPNIHLLKIEAPNIARKAQAGQFVIVRVDERGERIPLTIADWDREQGNIDIVFHRVGTTTGKLAALAEGDFATNVVGPLGLPAEADRFGTVVCIATGYSIATIVPIVRTLKEAGNRVISLVWAPSKGTLFGDERLDSISDRLIVATGDGSYDFEGFLFEPVKKLLEEGEVDRVIVIGPTCVMKLVANITGRFDIKTVASLNPIMVDGTGMCGVCRVTVGGETRFACVDGPAFDAHQVDWNELMVRRCTYSGDIQPVLHFQCYHCAQW